MQNANEKKKQLISFVYLILSMMGALQIIRFKTHSKMIELKEIVQNTKRYL
jgi:hypothetical protein